MDIEKFHINLSLICLQFSKNNDILRKIIVNHNDLLQIHNDCMVYGNRFSQHKLRTTCL